MLDVKSIIDYEEGNLSEEDAIALFQELVDSGLAWKLQGHYGRIAMILVKAGLITLPESDRVQDAPFLDGNQGKDSIGQ